MQQAIEEAGSPRYGIAPRTGDVRLGGSTWLTYEL